MFNQALLDREITSTPVMGTSAREYGRSARFINMPKPSSSALHPDLQLALAQQLVARWLDDTRYVSATSSIKAHSSFPVLVNIGTPVLRWIIAKMAAGEVRIQWFPLLKAIAGQDPVPPQVRGHIGEMTNAWIGWAKSTTR